jgi:transposase
LLVFLGIPRINKETKKEIIKLKSSGWQQRDIAKKFGIDQSTVSRTK